MKLLPILLSAANFGAERPGRRPVEQLGYGLLYVPVCPPDSISSSWVSGLAVTAGRLPCGFLASWLPADRGEPVFSAVEFACDHRLDVAVQRSVGTNDELAQRGPRS
jgi:hypothetical protein